MATLAPIRARAAIAAASAAAVGGGRVVLHPVAVGGSFGAALDPDVGVQAAVIARRLGRPVSLTWSLAETARHDRPRLPAQALLSARLGAGGQILGWRTRIAAPAAGHQLARRLFPGAVTEAAIALARGRDAHAVAGAHPPYRLPAMAVEHHLADIGIECGYLRGGAHGYACFLTETFLDELAHAGGNEAVSFRIGMLGGQPRLARVLSTAASLGGWDGGTPGSGQGIAVHSFRGSHAAVFAEARVERGRVRVDRLVAAVDCGRLVAPDLVRQQVEGALVFGMAEALTGGGGGGGAIMAGMGEASDRGWARLPRLADTPDITVELIRSDEAPGGAGEIALPPVAPAIANALATIEGRRRRTLPLDL